MSYNRNKNSRTYRSRFFNPRIMFIVLAASALLAIILASVVSAQLTGNFYTTDAGCTGVDLNIYASKGDVYINGGPQNQNAGSGLPDGCYYVQVTAPDGTLLGTSVGSGLNDSQCSTDQVVHVTDGAFDHCYQLSAIVKTAGACTAGDPGYCDTTNPGGEYKVWISPDPTFPDNSSKTDNFKVAGTSGKPPQGLLKVIKFYDADTSGTLTAGDTPIAGWQVEVGPQATFASDFDTKVTPVSMVVDPGCWTALEGDATGWIHTNTKIQSAAVIDGGTTTIEFGNVCLGAGGGLTLGFWSNKNGQALITSADITALDALCLRNADGSNFDPASKTDVKNFLLNANATNMSNMLSAQLIAMYLNVAHGFVNGGAFIFAGSNPSGCSVPVNGAGFITVNALMTDANTELCNDGSAVAGDPQRTCQEFKKNALDKANNNLNFVQTAAQCGVVDGVLSGVTFTFDNSLSAPACP